MSKTKKTTTTAKQSKARKSFNLRSRKVQFFVTILVIAIVGGGYLTYRSFALTITANYSPATLKPCSGTPSWSPISDGNAKNPTQVVQMNPRTCVTPKSTTYATVKDRYAVCASVMGSGTIGFKTINGTGLSLSPPFNSPSTYSDVCSTSETNTSNVITVYAYNSGSTTYKLRYVYVLRAGDPSGTANPTPTK